MYERFFGLEEEPFRLTPDPRYLYRSVNHAEALAHLRLGLTESSGFVCITGEVGTGKTTLLQTFLAELGPDVAAAYTYVPPLSAMDLLLRICREFGVTPASQGQSDVVDGLQAYLVAQRAAGRVCVVVLDEAQALSIDLLEQVRLLLNFETPTEKLLRIVLVGQPQLRKLLLDRDLAQLNQRITLRWHLGPLSYRETVAYVRHRLAVASGGRASELYTWPALRLLHSVSGGVPRLINMLAHRALLTAFVERQSRVGRKAMMAAYREIQSVPLPGTLTFASRAAVAVAGLALGATIITVGAPRLGWRATAGDTRVEAASVTSAQSETPATVSAEPPPVVAAAVASETRAPEPAPAPVEPAICDAAQFGERIRGLDPAGSERRSTETLLSAWNGGALNDDERNLSDGLTTIAWRRGLQSLALTANLSMLRVLDLPAQLLVRAPGQPTVRFVTLTGITDERVTLDVDGSPVAVDAATLATVWSGQARVLWRDHDGLGPVLARGASGVAVMQLQTMLQKLGTLTTRPTGSFDPETETAVMEFQRSHHLEPDGRVGPFTRILLYAVGERHQPSLDGTPGGLS